MTKQWLKDIIEKSLKESVLINGEKYNRILSPKKGDLVLYYNEKKNTYEDVIIKSGRYWGNRGISNFWEWISKDSRGVYCIHSNGYGDFYIKDMD